MSTLFDRVAAADRRRLDVLLAIALTLGLELEVSLHRGISDSQRLLTAVAIVLFAAPVALRRRSPRGGLIFASTVVTVQALLGGKLDATNGVGVMLALALLAYSVGALLELRSSALTLTLSGAVFSGFVLGVGTSTSNRVGTGLFILGVVFVAPAAVGRVVRERGRRTAAFRELAAQAAADREERERLAMAEERERIGRELQDIIAHTVSAMVVQAGGARRLLRTQPDRARDSILAVETTGREALADLRRLLGMLRRDGNPRELAPQPGLEQLATLAESVRAQGVACELRTEGRPTDLTLGIDLVGYRVVEAALERAVRRRSNGILVTVHYRANALELDIQGDGAAPDLDGELRGISERVALYDGSLRVRPAAGAGFSLHARLPLASRVA